MQGIKVNIISNGTNGNLYLLTGCYEKDTITLGEVWDRNVETGGIRELPALSALFCYEPKIALKNKIY